MVLNGTKFYIKVIDDEYMAQLSMAFVLKEAVRWHTGYTGSSKSAHLSPLWHYILSKNS
jgi:hypothetical protein